MTSVPSFLTGDPASASDDPSVPQVDVDRAPRHVAVIMDGNRRWARERGLHIEDDPREWSYMPGYYAGFFHDPDGIKLEVVFEPHLRGRPDE